MEGVHHLVVREMMEADPKYPPQELCVTYNLQRCHHQNTYEIITFIKYQFEKNEQTF
jgi:hypothetical protein